MDGVLLLAQGMVIGLTVASPIGPINVLCIQRTLAGGARVGFATATGCAAADASYAAVSVLGLVGISGFLVGHEQALRMIGAAVLVWLGLSAWRRHPVLAAKTSNGGAAAAARTIAGTYLLTITNPLTILIFASLFAGVGLPQARAFDAVVLIGGVFLGTFLWMGALVVASLTLRARLGERFLRAANRIGAVLLLGFGMALAWLALKGA